MPLGFPTPDAAALAPGGEVGDVEATVVPPSGGMALPSAVTAATSEAAAAEEDSQMNAVLDVLRADLAGPAPERELSARSESGYKGVHKVHANAWAASIKCLGRQRNIGTFRDIEEAALAYAYTQRLFRIQDERGRLRPTSLPPRPQLKAPKRSASPVTAATLAVYAELDEAYRPEASDNTLPCVYEHPLAPGWCAAAWCGSSLGGFTSPDEAAAALIALVELGGGDRPQPPSSWLTRVELLPAPPPETASVIAEVVADLVWHVELGLVGTSLEEVRLKNGKPDKKPPKQKSGSGGSGGEGGAQVGGEGGEGGDGGDGGSERASAPTALVAPSPDDAMPMPPASSAPATDGTGDDGVSASQPEVLALLEDSSRRGQQEVSDQGAASLAPDLPTMPIAIATSALLPIPNEPGDQWAAHNPPSVPTESADRAAMPPPPPRDAKKKPATAQPGVSEEAPAQNRRQIQRLPRHATWGIASRRIHCLPLMTTCKRVRAQMSATVSRLCSLRRWS